MSTELSYPIGKYEPQPFGERQKRRWLIDIQQLPGLLEDSILNLDEAQLHTPYREGGWSPHQVVHHVADSHINAFCRVKLILTEDNPTIKPYREDLWAELSDVKQLPINVSLTLLHALHARIYAVLYHAADTDWERTYFHPESNKQFYTLVFAGHVCLAWPAPHSPYHYFEGAYGLVKFLIMDLFNHNMPNDEQGKWKHLSTEYILKEKWFNFRRDRVLKGNGQEMFPYYLWEFSNWAAVFPITTDGKVILVKQYRYAAGSWSIELPGGIMDPHETNPEVAAKRELLEETGYSCRDIKQVTAFSPNPATQNNLMYGFVATGCTLTHAQSFDENEEIQVITSTVDEVKPCFGNAKFYNPYTLRAFCMHLNI